MKNRRQVLLAVSILPIAFAIGCSSADDRYVELANKSTTRQAEQNRQIAQQSQAVADSTRELVQADGQSRHDFIQSQAELQKEIHVERQSVDQQHERLAAEQRELAADRQREPIIANAIIVAATLSACSLPIVFCLIVLRALNRETGSDPMAELLVRELTSRKSILLQIESDPRPAVADVSGNVSSAPCPNDDAP